LLACSPTREKHGWLGDAQDVGESAMMTYDSVAVFEAFLRTIRDAQTSQGDVVVAAPGKPAKAGEATAVVNM